MLSGVIADGTGTAIARWVVSNRDGGFSHPPYDSLNQASHVGDAPVAVAANRGVLAATLGVPDDRMVYPGLTHSTDVGVVEGPVGLFPNVDILITSRRSIGLVTMGADCVPVVLVEPVARIALTAHVGWRGAADGMLDAICNAVDHAGGNVSRAVAVFGPSICGRCYVVDEERRTAVLSTLPESGDVSAHGVDIAAGLAAALTDKGVSVSAVGSCTYEDKSWFSHRRDGITGRQAAAVVLL
mgnify:FL=1